jgi:hypothetical protein
MATATIIATAEHDISIANKRKKLKAGDEGIWRNTTRQYCGSNKNDKANPYLSLSK